MLLSFFSSYIIGNFYPSLRTIAESSFLHAVWHVLNVLHSRLYNSCFTILIFKNLLSFLLFRGFFFFLLFFIFLTLLVFYIDFNQPYLLMLEFNTLSLFSTETLSARRHLRTSTIIGSQNKAHFVRNHIPTAPNLVQLTDGSDFILF